MLNKIGNYKSGKGLMTQVAALALAFWVFASVTNAQTTENMAAATTTTAETDQKMTEKKTAPVLSPILTNYKEIKIGTPAEEVRDKLGKAIIDDKDGFFYDKDGEMVQIRLDKDKKVRLIAITYTDKNKNAPSYSEVFGTDAASATKPDGSIYNLVRYPAAGYWVVYSRTAGDKPVVTVTMQKMRKAN